MHLADLTQRLPARGQTMVEFGLLAALIIMVAIGGLTVLGPSFATLVRGTTDGNGAAQPGVTNVQAASDVVATATPYSDTYGAVNNPSGTYGGGDTTLQFTWDGTILNGAGDCGGPCNMDDKQEGNNNSGGGF